MEVINEAQIKQDEVKRATTKKLMLDACTCTGNCPDSSGNE